MCHSKTALPCREYDTSAQEGGRRQQLHHAEHDSDDRPRIPAPIHPSEHDADDAEDEGDSSEEHGDRQCDEQQPAVVRIDRGGENEHDRRRHDPDERHDRGRDTAAESPAPARWGKICHADEFIEQRRNTYVDDYLDRRDALRAAHLEKAWAAVDNGDLLLGGAVGDGPYTALLIFTGEDPLRAARAFAEADPYVTGGLVLAWEARPWTTVVGNGAATPVRP